MFKDLQKLVQQSQQEQECNSNKEFERLRDKPFWIWNVEEHKQEDINTSQEIAALTTSLVCQSRKE